MEDSPECVCVCGCMRGRRRREGECKGGGNSGGKRKEVLGENRKARKIDRGDVVSIHNTQCAVTRNPHTHTHTLRHKRYSSTTVKYMLVHCIILYDTVQGSRG